MKPFYHPMHEPRNTVPIIVLIAVIIALIITLHLFCFVIFYRFNRVKVSPAINPNQIVWACSYLALLEERILVGF